MIPFEGQQFSGFRMFSYDNNYTSPPPTHTHAHTHCRRSTASSEVSSLSKNGSMVNVLPPLQSCNFNVCFLVQILTPLWPLYSYYHKKGVWLMMKQEWQLMEWVWLARGWTMRPTIARWSVTMTVSRITLPAAPSQTTATSE